MKQEVLLVTEYPMQVWQDVINWGDEYHGISIFSISRSAANTTPA
ncbi:hypothetical protein [Segetibacter aerophilus]|nr:hypothetical protein [Segetibacter aerophilus]